MTLTVRFQALQEAGAGEVQFAARLLKIGQPFGSLDRRKNHSFLAVGVPSARFFRVVP